MEHSSDPLRDSALRYVAFTSDVGEAFKPFIARRLYLGSYAIVAAYGLLDVADKGRRAYAAAAAPRRCSPAPMPAIAAASLAAPGTSAAAAAGALALAPELPLAALSASSASAALRRTAAACAACLPPQQVYAAAASSASEGQSASVPVAAAVLDTALWHGAASLALPAILINRTVWAARQLLSTSAFSALPPRARALAPSAAGLALIPLVVPHIDEAVTEWMDAHLRPHLPKPQF